MKTQLNIFKGIVNFFTLPFLFSSFVSDFMTTECSFSISDAYNRYVIYCLKIRYLDREMNCYLIWFRIILMLNVALGGHCVVS